MNESERNFLTWAASNRQNFTPEVRALVELATVNEIQRLAILSDVELKHARMLCAIQQANKPLQN